MSNNQTVSSQKRKFAQKLYSSNSPTPRTSISTQFSIISQIIPSDPHLREDTYTRKIIELYKRLHSQAVNNQENIKNLKQANISLKNITHNQSLQLENGIVKLIKQQYVLQTDLMHAELNKIKNFMVDICEQQEQKKELRSCELQKYKNNLGQAEQQLSKLNKEISLSQTVLQNKRTILKADSDKLKQNEQIIKQRQSIQLKYLQIMKKLNKNSKKSCLLQIK